MATFESYLSWLKSNGCIFTSLEQEPQGAQHLVAKVNIEPQKAFLFVNNAVIITPERARSSELAELLNEALFTEHEEAENFTLFVFLMWERMKGADSFWHLYFEFCQFDDLLMFWTDAELNELQDANLKTQTAAMRQVYEREWEYVYNVIKFSPQFETQNESDLKELFKWAYVLVTSRCFSSGLPSAMIIPLADSLNHSNADVAVDILQSNDIRTIRYGVDYSDFTCETIPDQKPKILVNRQFKNRLQKYTDLNKVRKLQNIWELDKICRNYESSTDQEDNDTDNNSSSEESAEASEESEEEEEEKEEGKEEEEESSESEDEKEPEAQDFDWYSWDLTEAFVIIKTGKKSSFPKGRQVMFSYGRRSNAYLLKNYGFCLPYNVYDSVKVKVWADRGEAGDVSGKNAMTEYRFKRTKLNEQALEYFRIKVLRKAPNFPFSRTTSPFDSRIEYAVLQHMNDFYKQISQRFTTTIMEDEELLAVADLPSKLRFAIYYRLGQKKIVEAQQRMNEDLLSIIMKIHQGEAICESHLPESEDQYELLHKRYPFRHYLRKYEGNLRLKQSGFETPRPQMDNQFF